MLAIRPGMSTAMHVALVLPGCRYNPIKTIKTNFLGSMNMLGLAKRTRARFLLTSTSEVYGDPIEHPQTERYWGNVNCIGERSCYDEGACGLRTKACFAK
jgi:nucleoside-diphosphate-sugar epimerase